MLDRAEARVFEDARPGLLGLAYRILGSLADAEDAVQDTFLKWAKAKHGAIENPSSWLTTACTRRCIDMLRASHRSRVSYVGAWLPEPIQKHVEDPTEANLDLVRSLKTAFLLMLERLTPRERAAYLLHEIFETPYAEIAQTLEMSESACRKLVSRAKRSVDRHNTRYSTPVETQNKLLAAFQAAIKRGTTAELAALLSDDVRLTADGGGKVPAVLEVLNGAEEVTAFLAEKLREYWTGRAWDVVDLNGVRGIVLRFDGRVESAVSFAYDPHGQLTDIYIVRNPEKLENLGKIRIH